MGKDTISRRAVLGAGAGIAAAGLSGGATAAPVAVRAVDLRVEWLSDPVGIDSDRPRFRWRFEAADGARDVAPPVVRVLVASRPKKLAARRGDIWDSGPVSGFDIQPPRPLGLRSHTAYFWAVIIGAHSAQAQFITGMMMPGDWRGQWIAARRASVMPAHVRGHSPLISPPEETALPLFRKAFALETVPSRAVVSVCGLGHFELMVNGQPATDSVLNPGWSAYERTLLYTTYDVTHLLTAGDNVLGVRLGGGMYDVQKQAGRKSKFVDSSGAPKLLLQLSLDHGGHVDHVVSDESWRTIDGSILFSSMYGGEDADGRREPEGWMQTGADIGAWKPVLIEPAPAARLKAQGVPPVRVQKVFKPVAITEPKPGVFVCDFGENASARPDMVVRGPAGATVRLVPSEILGEDGLAWQKSFNAGPPDRWVLYNYTLAGKDDERFTPRFSYSGFRYLQVDGAVPAGHANPAGLPEIIAITSQFLHADLPPAGDFACSDALLERTHKIIERSVLSNAFSVLTDCPHREKLGWLEQTHLNAPTIMYNRECVTLYEKMIGDIVDSQQADGMVPGIAPEYVAFVDANGKDEPARNSPEWGAAVILSPWAAYRAYGDARVLRDGYAAMRRYLEYLSTRAQDHIVDFGLGDWYDNGPGKLGASQLTSRALTATATWYQALTSFAAIAQCLGRLQDAAPVRRQAEEVKAAFNARFFNTSGVYDRNSQTANAMPLALGMVPPGHEASVLDALVRAVRANENGVTAGDVGFRYVVEALSAHDRDDVMLDMMQVTDRPSYGYQLARGVTALAESWNADPTKSLNHFMLGQGEGWLFGSLAGIRVDFSQTPERVLTIAPRPVGNVTSASASHSTVFGEVESAWRRDGGTFYLDVTVPTAAKATIIVPAHDVSKVREGEIRVSVARGIHRARRHPRGLELITGSGRYRFTAPYSA